MHVHIPSMDDLRICLPSGQKVQKTSWIRGKVPKKVPKKIRINEFLAQSWLKHRFFWKNLLFGWGGGRNFRVKSGRKQQTQLKQTMIFPAIFFQPKNPPHRCQLSTGHIQVASAVCGLGTLPVGDLGGLPKKLGRKNHGESYGVDWKKSLPTHLLRVGSLRSH